MTNFLFLLFILISALHLVFCIIEERLSKNPSSQTNKTLIVIQRITDYSKITIIPLLILFLCSYYFTQGSSSNTEKLQTISFSDILNPLFLFCALVFGTLGDYFLLEEQNKRRFHQGLLFFLFGHFCYLKILIPSSGLFNQRWFVYPILLIVYTIGVWLSYKTARKPKGITAVFIILYSSVLCFLHFVCTCQLFSTLGFANTLSSAILALIGATLFIISDTLLVIRIFRKKFRLSRFLVMLTYICAQSLIAFSLISSM